MGIALLSLSVLLQFAAAILAVRLIRLSGRAAAWILIASAITLMGIRRGITLAKALSPNSSMDPDITAEAVALLISVLMVAGVALIGRIFGALRDSQLALETSRARYSTLVHGSPDGIIALDPEDRVETFNQAAEEITGIAAESAFGRRLSDLGLFAPSDQGELERTLARAKDGERVPAAEVVIHRPERPDATVELTPRRLAPDPGAVGMQLVLRDVDARKQLEKQLAQSQKLEALGLLAGGVAHDFNNLLTVIMAGTEILESAGQTKDEGVLADIQGAASRAAQLTEQLLAFGRRQRLQPRAVNLSETVSGLEMLLRTLIGERIDLQLELDDPSSCGVFADPTQLEQVVINLAVNARDAMPDGGTLTIRVSRRDEVSPPTPGPPSAPGWVELCITDTGRGMDDVVLSHLFEPFFSTKEKGHGTGLGLATVHGIVEQSQGHVRVSSELGEGSTFSVVLPAHDTPAPHPSSVQPSAARRGEGLVLVVEDEDLVRSVSKALLESLGYEVMVASDGAAALALVASCGRPIDLLVTDMVMPGLNGAQLADALHRDRPDLPVIIMSGHTAEHDIIKASGATFLSKPFTRNAIGDAVARALRIAAE